MGFMVLQVRPAPPWLDKLSLYPAEPLTFACCMKNVMAVRVMLLLLRHSHKRQIAQEERLTIYTIGGKAPPATGYGSGAARLLSPRYYLRR